MKTIILDEKQYPFEIKPETIKVNFALFRVISGSRQDSLVLFNPDKEADDIVHTWERGDWDCKCTAKGSFKYTGDRRPPLDKWESDIDVLEGDKQGPALSALRAEILEKVKKCMKGEFSEDESPANETKKDNDGTQLSYVPFFDESLRSEDLHATTAKDAQNTNNADKPPVQPPPIPIEVFYPKGQPTVTL